MKANRVAVVGSGYVGTVVAACLGSVGHEVIGVENDAEKLGRLQTGSAPFYEPGLDEVIAKAMETGQLVFTDDMSLAMDRSDVVFLCVGTPSGGNGHPELDGVAAAVRAIGASLRHSHVLVTKSTVPIGSGMWLEQLLEDALPNGGSDTPLFSVVSNPEFLREGSAIEDFLHPDRIVLGSGDQSAIAIAEDVYRPILDQSFDGGDPEHRPVIIRTGLETAETIKYAANAFLASKISFINEIAQICERVGADVTVVADAIGLDSRIGRDFLNAGVGWGGSCFSKDLGALSAMAKDYGVAPRMLDAVAAVNKSQRFVLVEKLQARLKSLRGRRVALLGLAFKPGTDDLRDAPSLEIAERLHELGASVVAYDPVVKDLPEDLRLRRASDPYLAAERADALILVTDWPEFAELNFERLATAMRGSIVLDGRNMLPVDAVTKAGLTYEGVGRGDIGPLRDRGPG